MGTNSTTYTTKRVYDLATIPTPSDNVFEILNPATYGCRVWKFNPGDSTLAVFVMRDKHSRLIYEDFYLVFSEVRYFEGPMTWKGANFSLATMDEYARLMHRLQARERLQPDDIPDSYNLPPNVPGRLFRLLTPNYQVCIVANHVYMTRDISKL